MDAPLGSVRGILSFVVVLCLAAYAPRSWADGPNLLTENTSFEVGTHGWVYEVVRFLKDWGNYGEYGIDTTTAAEGNCSLRFDKKTKGVFRLISKTATCEAGKPYTVSFYARADRPDVTVAAKFGPMYTDVFKGRKGSPNYFRLTTEWKRYSFGGVVPTDPEKYRKGVYDFWLNVMSNAPIPTTLWVDAIKIEEGELGPYAPTAPVEVGFESDKDCQVYEAGEPGEVRALVYSVNPDFKGKLRLELEDY